MTTTVADHVPTHQPAGPPGPGPPTARSTTTGIDDKIQNAGEDLAGKGKEAAGDAKGDDQLEAEGRTDQSKADVKKTGENVKDAFKN